MSGPNGKVVVHNNSGPAVGTKIFLDDRGIKAWATVPREFILRHMAKDVELDTRFEFAAILWSWCGPHAAEYIVLKDGGGFEVTDRAGNAIPAKLSDLAELLGVDKANITRTAQALKARGSLRFDEGRGLALNFKPPPAADAEEKVVVHNNWNIAGVVVHNNFLPTDPEARANAIRFLESCHAQWNQERNDANARAREILRTGLLPNGIIIEKRRKNSKTNKAAAAASPAAPIEEASLPFDLASEVESPPEPASFSSAPTDPPLAPPTPTPAAETEVVVACLGQFAPADPAAARTMLRKCREQAPDASLEAICRFIDQKGPAAQQNGRSPLAVLLTSVPACFEGNWRARLELAPERRPPESVASRRDREEHEEMVRLINLQMRLQTKRGSG